MHRPARVAVVLVVGCLALVAVASAEHDPSGPGDLAPRHVAHAPTTR